MLRSDFNRGLACAVFLCDPMPTFLRISIPRSLPQLTIFRAVLLSLLAFWFASRRSWR